MTFSGHTSKGVIRVDLILKRISNLLCVKSIVTIVLTFVFAYLTVSNQFSGQNFLTVFSVIIAFYFGTQSQRLNDQVEDPKKEESKK